MCIRDSYKGEELIDTYTTDENGQFTTKYYICDIDWTVREISPSEGGLSSFPLNRSKYIGSPNTICCGHFTL